MRVFTRKEETLRLIGVFHAVKARQTNAANRN